MISEVVGQVQAIAQVYGLQVGEHGPLRIGGVVEAITASVQRTFGQPIRCRVAGTRRGEWALPEAESIPIALTLNELLTNAVKHSAAARGAARDRLRRRLRRGRRAHRDLATPARCRTASASARIPGGVSGLGLVRALLPRRSASLAIEAARRRASSPRSRSGRRAWRGSRRGFRGQSRLPRPPVAAMKAASEPARARSSWSTTTGWCSRR